MSGVVSFFQEGGVFMLPILLAGLVAFAIGLERAQFLFKKNKLGYEELWGRVKELVQAGNIPEAIRVCEATPSIYSSMIKAGLNRATRDEQQIQNALDVETMKVLPPIQARIGHLSLIANVATLLGLLGTITGLIQAFAAVAQADPAQKQALLANGISVAMNTTQFGLVVAVPTMVLFGWLNARSKKYTISLTQLSTELINELSGRLFSWMEAEESQRLGSSSKDLGKQQSASAGAPSPSLPS